MPLAALVLLLCPLAWQDSDETARAELLARIKKQGDDVTRELLYELAKPGDVAAFEALLGVRKALKEPATIQDAFYALWYFRESAELAARAVALLEDEALHASDRDVREKAVYPLSYFGSRSKQLALVTTLEPLTGLQLGRSAGGWQRWYDDRGASAELPTEAAVLALEAQRAAARAFVEALEIGGRTDIFGALEAAFEDDDTDTIYLLSDGDPSVGRLTDPLEIRAEVAQWNSVARVTIHCLSVGQTSRLLADLAHASGGTYLEVGLPRADAKAPK